MSEEKKQPAERLRDGNPSVVSAYEQRLGKLEREKIVLTERSAKALPPKGRLEECIELTSNSSQALMISIKTAATRCAKLCSD